MAYAAEDNTYDTDKKFTGKTYDSSTGLHYYGARYYDSELCRFITADPTIQHPYDPQDFNRYAYARNNPVKYIDPTGLGFWDWLKSFWKAIVAVAIVVVTAIVMVVAPQTAPVTFPMLLGQMSLGITGATSAAIRGGDIGEGMLFGVIAGSVAGLGLGAMGPAIEAGGASVLSYAAQGAIAGTAAGATSAYAGGKGSIQDVIFWSAMGNISGATMGALEGIIEGVPVQTSIPKAISGPGALEKKLAEFGYETDLLLSSGLKVQQDPGQIVIASVGIPTGGLQMIQPPVDFTPPTTNELISGPKVRKWLRIFVLIWKLLQGSDDERDKPRPVPYDNRPKIQRIIKPEKDPNPPTLLI